MKTKFLTLCPLLFFLGFQVSAQNTMLTYQGQLLDDGAPYNGLGQFQFALVTSTNLNPRATATATRTGGFITSYNLISGGSGYVTPPVVHVNGGGGSGATATATVSGGVVTAINPGNAGNGYTSTPSVILDAPPVNVLYTTYWSNDGTSVNGSQPGAGVGVTVSNGLFTVALGDTTQPNMAAIPMSVFNRPNLQLRIWFDDGVHGSAALDPAQSLTPTPYAAYANSASNLVGGLTIQQNTNGAPNLIGGAFGNYVSNGVVGATIAGGGSTNLDGSMYTNSVTGDFGTVSGGVGNSSTERATIGGGSFNTANGYLSTIGGGFENIGAAEGATVAGGYYNIAGLYSTVGGGYNNDAEGTNATVGGGYANFATNYAATVGGGVFNYAAAFYTTVGGGYNNEASGFGATVGGGRINTASSFCTTVAGGTNNLANVPDATVGGGSGNTASGFRSTVAGGFHNTATSDYTTTSGGNGNHATGLYSTIPGGYQNTASGISSFAIGYTAQASHQGAFVWADYTAGTFSSTANNQFSVRATGGYRFITSTGGAGAQLSANATSWSVISDRNAKKNFAPLDHQLILDKLAQMPVQQWNYKWEADSDVPNIGPMAQDFKSAFYPGRDDKSISTLEFDGVELAAIQGLNEKVEVRSQKAEDRIQQLEAENAELKQRLEAVEKILGQ